VVHPTPLPGRFTPGEDPLPLVKKAGWAPGPVWTGAENLASTGIRSRTVQSVAQSLYRLSYQAHVSFMYFRLGTSTGPSWPRGLRCRSAAARLLRSRVRIPPWTCMYVCCECCVLSGRGLCDELITRQEESYRLRCVVVCDLETS